MNHQDKGSVGKGVTTPQDHSHLNWFLGPKAENRDLFEEMLLLISRDYVHWRSNYFPGDKILLSRQLLHKLEPVADSLIESVQEMMAGLRRNFPFYSPRYLGHMLSETSMPSVLGYFAGMLYNPNNVTPEAAPVTVDWEIEACNKMLRMFGFTPPPLPRKDETEQAFASRLPTEFGWAHTTFDGTTATIEALWVARNVKYLPLAIQDVCAKNELLVAVREQPIPAVDKNTLMLLSPAECLDLLQAFLTASQYSQVFNKGNDVQTASQNAWAALATSPFNLVTAGSINAFELHPPLLFGTGAAHYCLKKAVDILGIGTNRIRQVQMDSRFRMNIDDLEVQLRQCIAEKRDIPLVVFAICSTTEEGAVDPIHRIVDLRTKLEGELGASFWIHVDAAWGGYFRALFTPSDKELVDGAFGRLCRHLAIDFMISARAYWYRSFAKWITTQWPERDAHRELLQDVQRMRGYYNDGSFTDIREFLSTFIDKLRSKGVAIPEDILVTPDETLVQQAQEFTHMANVQLSHLGVRENGVDLSWFDPEVYSSFLAVKHADSVVTDPHKMGYCVYPTGVVAYRDNRARRCIRLEAPYITSLQANTSATFNLPAKRPRTTNPGTERETTKIYVEAFATSILEGSRPGAAASSLWLSTQAIPPNREGHGKIVRSALWAARELYEWLTRWETMCKELEYDTDFVFIPATDGPPDTNVVTFVVKHKVKHRLAAMNQLTDHVYNQFSIQTELGERQYSYSQAFFVSHTTAKEPHYPVATFERLFTRCALSRAAAADYKKVGLSILRAAVMNPYLESIRTLGVGDLIHDFVNAMAQAAGSLEREA